MEEKWRPKRIGAPETREIRRGRWEGLFGKRERSGGQSPDPLGMGSLLSSQAGTPLQSPIQATWVLGA